MPLALATLGLLLTLGVVSTACGRSADGAAASADTAAAGPAATAASTTATAAATTASTIPQRPDASSSAALAGSHDFIPAGATATTVTTDGSGPEVGPTGGTGLSQSEADALAAELDAIERELSAISLPSDGDFSGIASELP